MCVIKHCSVSIGQYVFYLHIVLSFKTGVLLQYDTVISIIQADVIFGFKT